MWTQLCTFFRVARCHKRVGDCDDGLLTIAFNLASPHCSLKFGMIALSLVRVGDCELRHEPRARAEIAANEGGVAPLHGRAPAPGHRSGRNRTTRRNRRFRSSA